MKPKNSLLSLLAIAGSSLLAVSAHAATFTWSKLITDGTNLSTNWSSGSSWSAVPASAADTTLVFGYTWTTNSTARTNILTNDVANPFSLNVLTLGHTAPTAGNGTNVGLINIAGSSLNFVLNGATTPQVNLSQNRSAGQVVSFDVQSNVILGADTLFTGNGTANFTISGAISGGGDFSKSGTSTLLLTNSSNAYTGSTNVNGGILTAATTGSIAGWGSTGNVSVDSGATLGVRTSGTGAWTSANIDTLRSNVSWASSTAALGIDVNSGSFTYASNVSDALSIRKYGTGTLNLNGDLTGLGGSLIVSDGTLARTAGGDLVTTSIEAQAGTISAKISGTTAVTKTTTGTVTLSGANDYSGGFTLSSGTVGSIGSGTYAGFGSGTFSASNGTLSFNGGSTQTISNALSWGGGNIVFTRSSGVTPNTTWTGPLTLTGNQTITLGASTTANNSTFTNDISGEFGLVIAGPTSGASLTLSGANNTFSGGLNLNSANVTLNINSATALGSGTFTVSAAGVINNTSGSAVTLSNNNVQAWNSNFAFTGSNDLNMGTGAVTINGTRTVTVNGGKLTVGGNISGEFGFVKAGAGTLRLNGTGSTFATNAIASISITGGTLEVAKLSDRGLASSIGNANNDYSLRIGNGTTLRYVGGGDSTNYRLQYAGGGTATIESSGAGALNFTSTASLGSFSGGTAQTVILGGTNANSNTFSPQITDNGAGVVSLTKEGVGKWVVNNTNNSYTGATIVNDGILEVGGSGALTGTSGVTINGGEFRHTSTAGLTRNVTVNGGTFRYNSSTAYSGSLTYTSGTLAGTNLTGAAFDNQTIGAGKSISPGNSPGTMLVGSQTWSTDGSYVWEINNAQIGGVGGGTAGADPGWDLLSGTGTLTIDATNSNPFDILVTSLTLANAAGLATNFINTNSYAWLIADFANEITTFDASVFNIDITGFQNTLHPQGIFGISRGDSVLGGDNTQIYLTYAAVPEPGAALLGGLGILTILRRRRR